MSLDINVKVVLLDVGTCFLLKLSFVLQFTAMPTCNAFVGQEYYYFKNKKAKKRGLQNLCAQTKGKFSLNLNCVTPDAGRHVTYDVVTRQDIKGCKIVWASTSELPKT